MPDIDDMHDQFIIKNMVNNSVTRHPDSITFATFKFFAAGWSWVICEIINGYFDARIVRLTDALQ